MNHLVSFVIPVYNGENFIEASIMSCLNQTYKNIEVVVINDGSEDKSLKVVETLVQKFSNLKLVNMNHGGKVRAINEGIKHCCGDFIAIHAADDICFEYRIKEQLEIIIANKDCSLVCADCEIVDENLNLLKQSIDNILPDTQEKRLELLLHHNIVSGGTMLINGKFKDKIFPIPKSVAFEDWWIAFVSNFYGEIVRVDKPVIKYRQHSLNDNGSFNIKNSKEKYEKLKKDYLRHFNYYGEFKKYIVNNFEDENLKSRCINIINSNIRYKKYILSNSFNERIETLYTLRKDIIFLKDSFRNFIYFIFGGKPIYFRFCISCLVKRIFK